jgi:hypothetical protein
MGSKEVCVNFVIGSDCRGKRFPISRRLRSKEKSRIFQRVNGHWLCQFPGFVPQELRRPHHDKVRRSPPATGRKEDTMVDRIGERMLPPDRNVCVCLEMQAEDFHQRAGAARFAWSDPTLVLAASKRRRAAPRRRARVEQNVHPHRNQKRIRGFNQASSAYPHAFKHHRGFLGPILSRSEGDSRVAGWARVVRLRDTDADFLGTGPRRMQKLPSPLLHSHNFWSFSSTSENHNVLCHDVRFQKWMRLGLPGNTRT